MPSWTTRKLEEFLKLYRIEHIVQDDINYRQVTISKNDGISFRGSKIGKIIGRKRQFIIDLKTNPHTLLFTRQCVLDGSIGIAPAEVDECIVTENMPMMSVDTDIIEISYLQKLLLSDYLYEKIRLLTVVGSAQKSIHERDLLNIEIKLPDIKEQKIISKKFNSLDVEYAELKTELTYQQTLIKKLRQQILQEAIEGKLTAEWRKKFSPMPRGRTAKRGGGEYEHACVLLERIIAEKNQMIKDKKIKPHKTLPPILDEDNPFPLHPGWVWCLLDEITYMTRGSSPRPIVEYITDKSDGVNWIRIGDTQNVVKYITSTKQKITKEGAKQSQQVEIGDFILSNSMSYGKPFIMKVEGYIHDGWFLIKLLGDIDIDYFYYLLLSNVVQSQLLQLASGAVVKNIRAEIVKKVMLPLPPLAEQKAIVARIEKLLVICDQLEIKINEDKTHAEKLMRAVLKEAFAQK